MLNYLKSRFRRSPVKVDALLRRRSANEDSVSNAQFVSFLQQSGFRKRALNRHQKSKRLKRTIAIAAIWSFVAACTWIAYESAAALELF